MATRQRHSVGTLLAALVALVAVASAGHFNYLHLVEFDGDELAIQCLLSDADEGCTQPLAELKAFVPAIAATNCAQCSAEEREFIHGYFAGLFIRNPAAAFLIQNKYDPTGEFRRKHGDAWRSKGIPIYPTY